MTEEAIAQMTARRRATILQRTMLSLPKPEEPQVPWYDLILDANYRKMVFHYMVDIERTKGVIPFAEYVDLLKKHTNMIEGLAEKFTVEFIVRNKFIKEEYGIDQPDPRLMSYFR